MARPRLFLIDTFGFLFRAFHARARSGAPPMRTSTGVPTETVFIFNSMLKRLQTVHKPDYLAAVFESSTPTLREQQFAAYKANRPAPPPEFIAQIPHVVKLLNALRIPILEVDGYEADDVIGTLARQAVAAGFDVVIVSSDKDMLQLVTDRVSMINPAKDDEWYDPARVVEFLGVEPGRVPDLLALKGDAVDNIPGAPGIGEKGARDLIARFGTVEEALNRAAEVERKAYRESLSQARAQIELSKRLATIDTNVPLRFEPEACAARPPDEASLRQVYTELEFFSQLKELKPEGRAAEWSFRELNDPDSLAAWLNPPPQSVALALASAGEGMLSGIRLGMAARAGEAVSVPESLIGESLRLVASSGAAMAAYDAKRLITRLAALGIHLDGVRDDVLLYGFLLSADPAACSLEALATRYLDRKPGAAPEETAATVFDLAPRLASEVATRGLRPVYDRIDLPLQPVLARMERAGVRIDTSALSRLSVQMEGEIERLTAEIHRLAGHPFNVNSPQQLAKVLFEEMGLETPGARGKTKTPSTAADVLEALAGEHAIVRLVLEYRQVAKLKNTYVDALPGLINPDTGRLHTTFNPAGAATGRLSSSNPNLQNIPIRTPLGREIRAAFVPRPGWRLAVADYSQIELRLLAHFSRDPLLVQAFQTGEDIHARTAAEVFGVMPMMVTPELRRSAKAVNFGIIYGLSSFGLASQLGISRAEAERYIRNYFERYAGVKRFLDETIAEVRRTGLTRTLFGRERPIPDINSRNPNARGFAERTAVNTPLQGTAADLIKLAMIAIDAELRRRPWQSRMLLQVHDELVFEGPPGEIDELLAVVRREMENVHRLAVPLVVDTGSGDNWRDAK